MRALMMAMAMMGGLAWAAAAQAPGASETANGGTVTDLGSGVHSLTASPDAARSKPGGPGYGVSGGGSAETATSYGNYGSGEGAPGMRPANTGTAPSR